MKDFTKIEWQTCVRGNIDLQRFPGEWLTG